LKKTRRGKFSEISGIFRISEIPKFGNFSEIFRKFRKFRKIPEIVPGKSIISGVFTNDYSRKPRKNPRIFPPKSRGNPRHFRKISGNFRKFRKIPEVVPENSSILEVFINDYSRKPRKNPRIFPPKFRGNPGNSRNSGKFRKFQKFRKIPEISGKFRETSNTLSITVGAPFLLHTPGHVILRNCTPVYFCSTDRFYRARNDTFAINVQHLTFYVTGVSILVGILGTLHGT